MAKPYYHAVAFISDIHANAEALEAVLQDIEKHDVTGIYCLGDIVGYGPNPLECIRVINQLKADNKIIRMVCGNHDYGIALQNFENFSKAARLSNEWTTKQLEDEPEFQLLEYLSYNNFLHTLGRFQIAHSTINPKPEEWKYLKVKNARDNFVERKIVFVGHSHIPAIYSKYSAGKDWNPIELFSSEGSYFYPTAKEKKLKPGEGITEYRLKLPDAFPTMIVNVGAVGQPRDGNPSARYVLHLTVDYNDYIEYRQVGYDVKKTVQKHYERDLECDRELATRLVTGGKSSFAKKSMIPDWFPFQSKDAEPS